MNASLSLNVIITDNNRKSKERDGAGGGLGSLIEIQNQKADESADDDQEASSQARTLKDNEGAKSTAAFKRRHVVKSQDGKPRTQTAQGGSTGLSAFPATSNKYQLIKNTILNNQQRQ